MRQSQASASSDIHSELGELREINHFILNEEERFNKMFNLLPEDNIESELKLDSRPIFRVIKFFKRLENRLS